MELSGECNESIVSILVTNVISIIKSLSVINLSSDM